MIRSVLTAGAVLGCLTLFSKSFAETTQTTGGLATFSNNCKSDIHYFLVTSDKNDKTIVGVFPNGKVTILVDLGSKYAGKCSSASDIEKLNNQYINLTSSISANKEVSPSKFSCSYPDVINTVIKLAKQRDHKDPAKSLMFDIDISHFNLYTIITTNHEENATYCSAKLNVNYELESALKAKLEGQPPGARSLALNNFGHINIDQNEEYNIRYYTSQSDDGSVVVTVNWR